MPTIITRRILYVEDHDDTRDLVTLVLQDCDYDVTTAQTIDSALQLARAERFNLYLLDSWLPDGSGIDLCRRIREFDGHTPIIFYSAAAYEADRESALSAGAQGYLTKPASFKDLCGLVASLISEHRDGSQRKSGPLPRSRFSSETEG